MQANVDIQEKIQTILKQGFENTRAAVKWIYQSRIATQEILKNCECSQVIQLVGIYGEGGYCHWETKAETYKATIKSLEHRGGETLANFVAKMEKADEKIFQLLTQHLEGYVKADSKKSSPDPSVYEDFTKYKENIQYQKRDYEFRTRTVTREYNIYERFNLLSLTNQFKIVQNLLYEYLRTRPVSIRTEDDWFIINRLNDRINNRLFIFQFEPALNEIELIIKNYADRIFLLWDIKCYLPVGCDMESYGVYSEQGFLDWVSTITKTHPNIVPDPIEDRQLHKWLPKIAARYFDIRVNNSTLSWVDDLPDYILTALEFKDKNEAKAYLKYTIEKDYSVPIDFWRLRESLTSNEGRAYINLLSQKESKVNVEKSSTDLSSKADSKSTTERKQIIESSMLSSTSSSSTSTLTSTTAQTSNNTKPKNIQSNPELEVTFHENVSYALTFRFDQSNNSQTLNSTTNKPLAALGNKTVSPTQPFK